MTKEQKKIEQMKKQLKAEGYSEQEISRTIRWIEKMKKSNKALGYTH